VRRLETAIEAIERNPTKRLSPDAVVAELPAGFWVSQLSKRYEVPYGWQKNGQVVIPNLPLGTMRDMRDRCDRILFIRNRIAHHEPIFHLPLERYAIDLRNVLHAMCSTTAALANVAATLNAVLSDDLDRPIPLPADHSP
jgi:hypothetical protein